VSLYSDAQAIAGEMLTEFGASLQLFHINPNHYDVATATMIMLNTMESTHGVFLNYPAKDGGVSQIDGTITNKGDKRLLMSAVGLIAPPVIEDYVLGNLGSFTIKSVKTICPDGGVVIMYDCRVVGT